MKLHPSHELTFMSTDAEIKEVYFPKNNIAYPVRTCSLCEASLNFLRDGMILYFDRSCDCTSNTRPTIRSWTELLPYKPPSA